MFALVVHVFLLGRVGKGGRDDAVRLVKVVDEHVKAVEGSRGVGHEGRSS